ncbi:hypothetical protein MTR67_031333 [Solanum verrucosum]|uniref:Integrase catalytic domain-containing protein n=1 Tax=Solanum verrucosum TaxID=315347 RepID=A0AAF0U289_SOLVR|nr:hypothetical protein MTR67_031333 [Solanum verrucosum]
MVQLKEAMLKKSVEAFPQRGDRVLGYQGHLCHPNVDDLREHFSSEAHSSRYSIHPGTTKMYRDFWEIYWWNGMKKDIEEFVAMYRMTKSAHFIPVKASYSMEDYARLYLREMGLGTHVKLSTTFQPQIDGQSERTIQSLEHMLRACVIDFKGNWDDHLPLIEFAYNNGYHSRIGMAPFEALYGRRCISHVGWFEVGKFSLIGIELVHEAMEKVQLIREMLKMDQSWQNSYVDVRRRDIEFDVHDKVYLKISPTKGVMRFGKKRKLSPQYVGPY